jgi:membrane protease subunit HflK
LITTGRENVAQRIQKITQDTLDAYGSGVAIKQVLIQDATVHPQVMEAFDDVVAAGQDAERFQNEATIYKNDILPKARGEAIRMTQQAEGYKQSRIARAEGEAERFNQLYDAYKGGRDVTRERIYIETMESVMKNADTTIIDQEKGTQGVLPYLPLNKK